MILPFKNLLNYLVRVSYQDRGFYTEDKQLGGIKIKQDISREERKKMYIYK